MSIFFPPLKNIPFKKYAFSLNFYGHHPDLGPPHLLSSWTFRTAFCFIPCYYLYGLYSVLYTQ